MCVTKKEMIKYDLNKSRRRQSDKQYIYTSKGDSHLVNQDSAVVYERGNIAIYMVCDGHGPAGEIISKAVAEKLPTAIVSAIINPETGMFAPNGDLAIKKTILDLDASYVRSLKSSGESGCTVAGIVFDVRTRTAYMFSVGDSLCMVVLPNKGGATALPLQNAANMPESIYRTVMEIQWKTGHSLMGGSGPTPYMMIPGVPRNGLQLFGTMGDFDLKDSNPVVKAIPNIKKIGPDLPLGTKFLVTTDGYLDGIQFRPHTEGWYKTICAEIEGVHDSASGLVKIAKDDRGSTDDITVLSFEV